MMQVVKHDSCRVADKVREYILGYDEPANFAHTLDDLFADAIQGSTFDMADARRRGLVYAHYMHLRLFLKSLEETDK